MKHLIFILLLSLSIGMLAQTPATTDESAVMIAEICNANKISTLQCNFRQTKQMSLLATSMISKGQMYSKDGNKLRWEYTSPYTYTFVLNEDKVIMKSAEKTNMIDVSTSKMFRQITSIMMSSLTGQCLTDEKYFQVAMLKAGDRWIAKLTPQQKEMRQMFNQIVLHINPISHIVTTVELVEKSGDKTTIELLDIKADTPIDDSIFDVE